MATPISTAPAQQRDSHPYRSLWIGVGLISLHVTSYVPLFLMGVANDRNAAAMRIFEVFAVLWMLLPLGCVYGILVGKRSLAAGGPRVPAWSGILLNGSYLMIGLLLLLIALSGVTA